MDTNSVEIFYIIDEFCKETEKTMKGHIPVNGMPQKKRKRAFTVYDSEIITIMILFHQSHFRDLKFFYNHYIKVHCRKDYGSLKTN